MKALTSRDTWKPKSIPSSKEVVGCKCVFVIKHQPDGII